MPTVQGYSLQSIHTDASYLQGQGTNRQVPHAENPSKHDHGIRQAEGNLFQQNLVPVKQRVHYGGDTDNYIVYGKFHTVFTAYSNSFTEVCSAWTIPAYCMG